MSWARVASILEFITCIYRLKEPLVMDTGCAVYCWTQTNIPLSFTSMPYIRWQLYLQPLMLWLDTQVSKSEKIQEKKSLTLMSPFNLYNVTF